MSEVLHLFQCLAHGEPMCEFEEVTAIENKGFLECIHGRGGSSRQVLLVDMETWRNLASRRVAPGKTSRRAGSR